MTGGNAASPAHDKWFRYVRLVRLRWLISGGPLFAQLLAALSFLIRGPANIGQQPVIALGEVIFVWPIAFGLSGLLLLWSLLAVRLLGTAHTVGATVCVLYGVALFGGSALTSVGWTGAAMAVGMGGVHLFFAAAYAKGR